MAVNSRPEKLEGALVVREDDENERAGGCGGRPGRLALASYQPDGAYGAIKMSAAMAKCNRMPAGRGLSCRKYSISGLRRLILQASVGLLSKAMASIARGWSANIAREAIFKPRACP